MTRKTKGCARSFLIGVTALASVCLALSVVSYLVNRAQASQTHGADRLSEVDKVRLAEVLHLRQALGDGVMPGWAEADIPLILYNEQYLFLLGLPDPEEGWRTVPRGAQKGAAWELVPGDEFLGQPYYRQKMAGPEQNSQAFTVRVGSRWAGSLATLDWSRASMAAQVRQDLPGPDPALRALWGDDQPARARQRHVYQPGPARSHARLPGHPRRGQALRGRKHV